MVNQIIHDITADILYNFYSILYDRSTDLSYKELLSFCLSLVMLINFLLYMKYSKCFKKLQIQRVKYF